MSVASVSIRPPASAGKAAQAQHSRQRQPLSEDPPVTAGVQRSAFGAGLPETGFPPRKQLFTRRAQQSRWHRGYFDSDAVRQESLDFQMESSDSCHQPCSASGQKRSFPEPGEAQRQQKHSHNWLVAFGNCLEATWDVMWGLVSLLAQHWHDCWQH